MSDRFTISEVARQLHVSTSTLQKYERAGVIPKAQRTHGGWRVYTQADVQTISAVVYPRIAA